MQGACLTCGTVPTETATFCRRCGSPLPAAGAEIPSYNPAAFQPPVPGQPPPGSFGGGYGPPQSSYPPPGPQIQYTPGQWQQQPGSYYPNQAAMILAGQPSPFAGCRPVNPFMRWLAYFLDVIPMGFIHLIGMIPIVGNIIGGLLGILYMLFRDAMGASVGKQLIGNAIVTTHGLVPSKKELILRNVPLAVPYLFLMIPLVGPIICLIVGVPVFLTEHIMALATGLRVGDRLAGTRVIEKPK